jgi:hypothetical protein
MSPEIQKRDRRQWLAFLTGLTVICTGIAHAGGTTTRTVSHRSIVTIDEGGDDDALGDEYCIIVVAERFIIIVVAMVIAFWPFPSISGGHFFRGLGCFCYL